MTAALMNTHVRDNLAAIGAAWTAYTPTFASGGAIGNATRTGGFINPGKLVHFWAKIVLGSTTTVTGALSITLPTTALDVAILGAHGLNAMFNDASGNFYFGRGFASGPNASVYVAGTNGAASSTSATAPFTWVTTDAVYVSGTYESA